MYACVQVFAQTQEREREEREGERGGERDVYLQLCMRSVPSSVGCSDDTDVCSTPQIGSITHIPLG